MTKTSTFRTRGCAIATALLLAACQGSQSPADQQAAKTPSAAPVNDAPAVPPVPGPRRDDPRGVPGGPELPARDTAVVDTQVVNVRLSNDGNTENNTLGLPKTTFAPTDTVYAEVESRGTADSYTIYAKWIGADGTVLADYGIKINQGGGNRTVISLSKPDGWPKGENKIELAINGKTERTVPFVVQ